MNDLKEGEDFNFDEEGRMQFTALYYEKQGKSCCQSGCEGCPWDYQKKVDPNVPPELQDPWGRLAHLDTCTSGGCVDTELSKDE